MPKHLVIGYGNTLRSDDGFGPYVVRALGERQEASAFRLIEQQLLTVDLIDELAQAEACVLLDAATMGELGTLRVQKVEARDAESAPMGHDLSPAQLLAFTAQLMGHAPHCWLITARARTTELGEELSPEVAALVPAAIERTLELLVQGP
jgi:hydrogenase maturation protease